MVKLKSNPFDHHVISAPRSGEGGHMYKKDRGDYQKCLARDCPRGLVAWLMGSRISVSSLWFNLPHGIGRTTFTN